MDIVVLDIYIHSDNIMGREPEVVSQTVTHALRKL